MQIARTPFAVLLTFAVLALVYGSFKFGQRSPIAETGEELTGVRGADRAAATEVSTPEVTDAGSGNDSEFGSALVADESQQLSSDAQDGEPAAETSSQVIVFKTEFSELPSGIETSLLARIANLSYEEALLAFQDEPVDPVWAAEKVNEISSVLPGTLTGKVASTNLKCRSASCLVELYGDVELTDEPRLLIDLMRMANELGGKAALNADENDRRRGLLLIEWSQD